jgi:NAD(P)-dependent dehydrogenase (short-subunit alcohol dehydrogenase family)
VFATLKPQPFDEIPEAEWDRVMAVNVKSVWNGVRAVAPKGREMDRRWATRICSENKLIASRSLPSRSWWLGFGLRTRDKLHERL